jgi:hypothetical protein
MKTRRAFLRQSTTAFAGLGLTPLLSLAGGRDALHRAVTVRAGAMHRLRRKCGRAGDVALLERYHPGVEGGGGLFIWWARDPYGQGADGGRVVPARDRGYWVRPCDARVRAAWFGAGLTGDDDTAAMQRTCDAVPDGGTLHLDGDIALSAPVTLFDRSVTVEAEGARITMMEDGGFHAFVFGGEEEPVERVTWNGGVVEGNKTEQNWTDETTGVSYGTGVLEKKLISHGLVTIRNTEEAFFNDVTVRENVMAGLQFKNVGAGIARSCVGTDAGDPKGEYPGTFSSRYGALGQFEDCRTEGGNIGFVYTSGRVPPGSRFVVRGCEAKDMTQGAFWCEKSEEFVLEDFRAEATDPERYHPKVHINNSVRRTHIRRGVVEGAQIDFNNATQHEEGLVEDVRVTGHRGEEAAIHKASRTSRCVVDDVAGDGIKADVSVEDTVTDAGKGGIVWSREVVRPTVRRAGVGLYNPNHVEEGTVSDVDVGVHHDGGTRVLEGLEISDTRGPAVFSENDAERLVVQNCVLRNFGRGAEQDAARVGVQSGAAEVEITGTRFVLTSLAASTEALAYQGSERQERLVFTGNTVLGIKSVDTMVQHSASRATVEGNVVRTSGGG